MLNPNRNALVSRLWHTSKLGTSIGLLVCTFGLVAIQTAQADDTPASRPKLAPQLAVVYVDSQNTSGIEDGSQTHSFNTLAEGVLAVDNGGTIIIQAANYGDKLTINRPLTLQSAGGVATVGVNVPLSYKIFLPFIAFR